jgi:hypothetical protein
VLRSLVFARIETADQGCPTFAPRTRHRERSSTCIPASNRAGPLNLSDGAAGTASPDLRSSSALPMSITSRQSRERSRNRLIQSGVNVCSSNFCLPYGRSKNIVKRLRVRGCRLPSPSSRRHYSEAVARECGSLCDYSLQRIRPPRNHNYAARFNSSSWLSHRANWFQQGSDRS